MKKILSILFLITAFNVSSQTLVNVTATKQYDETGGLLTSTQATVYISLGNLSSVVASGSGSLVYIKTPVKTQNGIIASYSVTSTPAQINTAVTSTVSSYALTAGTVSSPTGAWSDESASGWYRIGANNYGYSVNGTKTFEFASTGASLYGLTTMTNVAASAFTIATTTGTNATFSGTTAATGIFKTSGTPQTLTGAGAVNITTHSTLIVSTGADAGTLAAGAEGQYKFIRMKTDGGDHTLTVTNLQGGTTIKFDDAGDFVLLYYVDSKWHILTNSGTTVA